MYEYVFFDLDGTLVDSGLGIINSALYALDKFNITVNEKNELRKFIGPPLQYSFSTDYGFNEEEVSEAISLFREYYTEKGVYENELYKHIVDVLDELKRRGKKLVVATSKPEVFTIKVLEQFDLLKYFDYVSAASLDASKIKKEEIIKEAIENLSISDLSKVVMVGDRNLDVLGAKINGVDSIGALWGFGSVEEFEKHNATFIAENVLDLLEFIK